MGAARDALDAATVAPTGFGSWAGIASNQSDAAGAVSATAEGMDPANSAADNTTFFNAAITKAGRNGKVVFDKSGTYQINAGVEIPFAGLTVEGANGAFVRIQQVTANENGLELIPDATYDFTNASDLTLRNLRIVGPGGGTTGMGIWSDPAASTYQGARLTLEHVLVENFDIGTRLRRFDNCFVHDFLARGCRVGWHSDGNANSIHIINGAATTCSEVGFIFGDGQGVTFHPGDIINMPKMIRCLAGSLVTIIGGNFESCTGTEGHIDIEQNAKVVALGQRFLKGSVETPGFRVALANLVVAGGTMSGFTTAPMVKKTNDGAVISVISSSTNLSGTDRTVQHSDAALVTQAHAPFPQRIDNSVPAAAIQYRGLVLHKVTRDAVSAEDALYWYGKDRSSGADVYTQRVMTNTIEGTGSPEGVVTARPGTQYVNRNGGAGTTLWVKETGTGNTGWAAK